MHRTLATVAAVGCVVGWVVGLAACGGNDSGGGGGAATATTSTAVATTTASTPGGVAVDCGTVRDEPADLDPELAALAADLASATGLDDAAPYERFRVVCDTIGATSTLVPDAWRDQAPGPADPPQPTLIVGPDVTARVEEQPVVGVGAARFVGDPPAASFVNANNAEGSLQTGTRAPCVGTSVAEGCTPLDPVPFRIEGYTGEIQPYGTCDGGSEARAWLVAVAFPDDDSQFQAQLIGQAMTTADLDALVGALASLQVDPDHVPSPELPPLPTPDGTG